MNGPQYRFSLFKDLSHALAEELSSHFMAREVRRGELIYSCTEIGNRVFFLLRGRVKLVEVGESGAEIIKEILSDNDVFGMVFGKGRFYYEYAEVLTERAYIYSIAEEKLMQMIRDNSIVSYNYLDILKARMKRIESYYLSLSTSDARKKLFFLLKEMAVTDGKKTDRGFILTNYLTQEEMANKIFIARQTLTRLLSDLRKEGRVKYSRSHIEVVGCFEKEGADADAGLAG